MKNLLLGFLLPLDLLLQSYELFLVEFFIKTCFGLSLFDITVLKPLVVPLNNSDGVLETCDLISVDGSLRSREFNEV